MIDNPDEIGIDLQITVGSVQGIIFHPFSNMFVLILKFEVYNRCSLMNQQHINYPECIEVNIFCSFHRG